MERYRVNSKYRQDNYWEDKEKWSTEHIKHDKKQHCCDKHDHHWHDKDHSDKHDWHKHDCCDKHNHHWHDKDHSDKHDWHKHDCCDKHDHHWHDKDHSDKHDWDKHDCCDKHNHWKKHKKCYDLYPGSPCCDDHFSVRLAGLEGGLNFRLRQLIGKEIKLFLSSPEGTSITGVLVMVGGDYVEIKPNKLQKKLPGVEYLTETIIVTFEQISKVSVPKPKHPHPHLSQKHPEADMHSHHPGCLCPKCRADRKKKYRKKKY